VACTLGIGNAAQMNPEIRTHVYVNSNRVVGSGSVICNVGEIIRIDLLPEQLLSGQGSFTGGMVPVAPLGFGGGMTPAVPLPIVSLELVIEREGDLSEPSLKSEPISFNTLRIRIINFENSIGQGVFTPVEVGKIMGKALKLSFVVYAVGPVGRAIHYNLLLDN
jgi:hypothetical protein